MKKSEGFGLIPVLVTVVIVAIVTVAGALVYKHNHKTTGSSTASNSSNSTQNQATDPYAGWKTYCDSTYNYCFKYPTDWTIDTSSSAQTTLLNPSKTIEVDYINPYTKDGNVVSFDTISISDLSKASSDLKVVGGIYSTVEPGYNLVDASTLNTYPLTEGQTSQFPNTPRFTDKYVSGSYFGAFRVRSTTTLGSSAEAKSWFNANDAKTSLLILQSFYYKQ